MWLFTIWMGCQPAAPVSEADTAIGQDSGQTDTGEQSVTDPSAAQWCQPEAQLSTPWPWEGESISVTVACTGDVASEDASLTLIQGPSTGVLDAEQWQWQWQTGAADGGRVDVVFSVAVPGQLPEALTVPIWVADNPELEDAQPVDPLRYQEEWGLPVVHIDVDGALSQTDQLGTVHWLGDALDVEIKIRGASSSYYPKPSYTIEFTKEEIELPSWEVSRDHLILLTTFDDNSYVRQKLIYDQWAAMAQWDGSVRLTPRTDFVVVYLNGSYQGLYVALDRIDNEFVRQMDMNDEGDLFKAVNHDANYYLYNSSGGYKSTLHDGYEKREGLIDDDFSTLDALVGVTGNAASATALLNDVADMLIIDEFTDWFLLVYYSLSEDSAGKNAYLYHNPDTERFHYVPWDFNHAWGQNWYTARVSVDSINDYTNRNRVFWALQFDEDAEQQMWERFDALRADGGPMSLDWQRQQLDNYYADIQPSAERDWAKWANDYYTYGYWSGYRNSLGDWQDFEGEKAYLYTWLDERAALFERMHPPAQSPSGITAR